MTYPNLYLSMVLGLGGVQFLISSFHDDDDGDDDGERYVYSFKYTSLAKQFLSILSSTVSNKSFLS